LVLRYVNQKADPVRPRHQLVSFGDGDMNEMNFTKVCQTVANLTTSFGSLYFEPMNEPNSEPLLLFYFISFHFLGLDFHIFYISLL
jgi:hypothetical protein